MNLKSGQFPNQNREACTGKETASWEAFIWMNEVMINDQPIFFLENSPVNTSNLLLTLTPAPELTSFLRGFFCNTGASHSGYR